MINVKALRDCKFGHDGIMYHFSEGDEREINVPIEMIDLNSFEVSDKTEKVKKVKMKFEEIKKPEEVN